MTSVPSDWPVLDCDREFYERELRSFVPGRVFDAHCHLYRRSHFRDGLPAFAARGPEADMATFQRSIRAITSATHVGGLFFGFPSRQIDVPANNAFVADEVRGEAGSRAQMLVTPDMDPEQIRETVRRRQFAGLKCYHVFAGEQPTWEAAIASYLPEEQVRIAHEEGLSITLHIVRARALADPANQEGIRRYAERFPNARFILAHAARGFNPHHTVEGIAAMRGLGNVWCDTSAVTDMGAHEAIIRTLGVDRLLYGSDFPVSHLRGRCVAVGDSFLWLSEENTNFAAAYGAVRPVLVGLEALRVLKLACHHLQLTDSQIEQIFYSNAARLFGLL